MYLNTTICNRAAGAGEAGSPAPAASATFLTTWLSVSSSSASSGFFELRVETGGGEEASMSGGGGSALTSSSAASRSIGLAAQETCWTTEPSW